MRISKPFDALQKKPITAYGVPFDSTTGQVSARTGVISTTVADATGHIQTDALTARGMSGGPVVLDETGALVGIVVGADLDVSNGLPTNYAVLAAEEVASELGLSEIEVNRVKRGSADYTYQYNHEGKLYTGHFAEQEGRNWIEYGTDPRGVQFNFEYQKKEGGTSTCSMRVAPSMCVSLLREDGPRVAIARTGTVCITSHCRAKEATHLEVRTLS